MRPEYRMLAGYLGRRISRFPEDCSAVSEFAAILEHRVSEISGIPMSSPRFVDEVDPVAQLMFEIAGDAPEEPDEPTPPTEEELRGLPVKSYLVTSYDRADRATGTAIIQARTCEEAIRIARPAAPPGTWAFSVTGAGALEGTA